LAARRTRRRRTTLRREIQSPLTDKPFRLLRNPWPPIEVLSEGQVHEIHRASMHILEEIGIEFLDDEAIDIWDTAGADVDRSSQRVRLDRGLVLEAVTRAPRRFTLRARNPEHDLVVGDNYVVFAPTGGTPYVSDFDQGRRPGTLAAFQNLTRLAQVCNPIHVAGGLVLEPQDVPVPIRHLDKVFSQFTLSDKAITTAAHGREVALDAVNMAAIVYGGSLNDAEGDSGADAPVLASNVNVNSPLRYDGRMLGALITYARHRQAVIVTPFLLAGAMSPVTLAAAIAQQNAEALAGIALAQLVAPGAPVVYGGFTTNVDMQTGSPAFGTPEGALALLAGAQLARYYGLPYRGSGSLTNAKVPDAQASYETQMTLWPAVLGHSNIIIHSAGWLEAGLVCSFEKYILDLEGLAMLYRVFEGIRVDTDTLALDVIAAVGPGGHHFGTAHTLARYRTEFYLPIVSDRQNFEAWEERGSLDAAQRAHRVWKSLLAAYELPSLDPAVEEELRAYVDGRKAEIAV
jgi:trimethylamine--corrinoid protein Co-methyltransferase